MSWSPSRTNRASRRARRQRPTYDVYAYLGPDGYNYDSAAYSFAINAIDWPLAWPDVVQ